MYVWVYVYGFSFGFLQFFEDLAVDIQVWITMSFQASLTSFSATTEIS